jgi:type I restriction enzyme S subunit
MNMLPVVKLGDVLRQEREQVSTVDGDGLPVLGVTNVEGVTQTGVASSADKSKYLRLRPGRFVYNPYRVNVGSIGLSSGSQDGICSPAYVVFAPQERIETRFLWFFLKSVRGNQLINFYGNRGSVRSALRFDDLCQIEIPLPPLAEQRRIVARIEELAAQINEAKELRRQVVEEIATFTRKIADKLLCNESTPRIALQSLLSKPLMNGLSVPASQLGSGHCFAKVGVVNSGIFNYSETKLVNIELASDSPYWLRIGDIVVSRGNSPEFVGRAAVYEGKPAKCAMPDLLIRVRVKPYIADAHFVSTFFHTTEARDFIAAQISGTSSTMPKISQSKLGTLPVPIPSLHEQRRIMAELDALQAEVDALKHLQAETAADLDALLPAVLDRAFKGEL